MRKRTRGRPLKYGRPARVVAVTLPDDTIAELRQIHSDLGRAIVTLVAAMSAAPAEAERPIVSFQKVGKRRSLIVVDREALTGVPGCELIPLSDDRAFLALEDGRGLPDLELALVDRLAEGRLSSQQREGLEALRRALRDCRRAPNVEIEPRSILVVEQSR